MRSMRSVRSMRMKAKTRFLLSFAICIIAAFATTTFALAQTVGPQDPHATPPHAPPPGHTGTFPVSHDTAHGPAEPAASGGHADHGAPHSDTHTPGAEHHGPEPMNWFDLSDKHRPAFVALLVNFGLLAAIYYTLGKKPIAEGLKQRRINIGKDIEEAQKLLKEAKVLAKKYQADLKNAEADALTAKTGLVAIGKGEVERQLTEAEERAERMKRDAARLVEQEKKQLHQDLLVETVNLAVTQAHRLLERSTTPEDHARLANELLAELARKPAAARVGGTGSVLPPRVGGTTS
jgi:F0F1-type ATP synthase membrane subunit b/b'